MNPFATAVTSGRARMISNRKQSPTVAMSVMTSASSTRTPRFCSVSSSSTSKPVMSTPTASGMSNSRLSAIAEPMTSARSHAAIAISQSTHSATATGREIVVAAGLREIAPGDDAELRREPLEQHGHEVREQDDAEQRVAEARSAGEVGGPVAGIHVADGDEIAGSGEGEELPKEAAARRPVRCDRPPGDSARRACAASPARAGRRRAVVGTEDLGHGHGMRVS